MASSKTPPWVWVAAGCGGALFLIAGCVVAVTYFGVRQVRQIEETMRDPEKRRAAALEVLNADELPEGYYPMMSFSVPLVMQTAILTDSEIGVEVDPAAPPLGDKGFIYARMLRFNYQDQAELRDYFEGKSEDSSILRRNNINVHLRPRDRIASGELANGSGQVLWISHRSDGLGHHGQGDAAVATMMLVECPGDRHTRFGILFGPDPAPETAVAEADWTGTPADPAEIAAFTGYFDFCAS